MPPQPNTPAIGISASTLLVENGLPHDGILAGHPSPEGTLNLCAEGQFIHVVGLFGGRDKALFLEGLVFQALQAIPKMMDVGQSGVSARQGGDSTVRVGDGRGAANGRESLGIAVLNASEVTQNRRLS